ncbi:MAG: serine hydrolase [Flavobacteriales bacterium]|nr:serine hydrolase [Flavobacteriales bacterium]
MKKIFSIAALFIAAQSGFAQLDSQLQSIFEDFELMGMSVAVVCGQGVDTYHYGLKDHTRTLEVDDSTMYRIASISKLVAATGLMKLYDDGLFALDDDISTYLGYEVRNPNWPNVPITFRMLLSHTGSLQDGTGYSGFLGDTYGNENPPSISEMLVPGGDNYTANMWRQEEPGTFFIYSNVNYGVIGTLIEAISGVRFDVFMKNEIFDPLDIAGSFNVADIENIDNLAVLYRNEGGWTPQVDNFQGVPPTPVDLSGYVPGTNGFIFAPQGGLRCSVFDLAKILVLHQQGAWNGVQLLQSSTLEMMHTPQWTYNGSNGDNYYGLFRSWGLGVQCTTDTDDGDYIWEDFLFRGHAGEAYGLISDLYWYSNDVPGGFVFMTNGAWNGFDFGNESAFYTLEEDVFQAVNVGNLQGCSLDVHEVEAGSCVLLYPNPSPSQLLLSSKCNELPESIRVYGSNGQCVEMLEMNSSSLAIQTSHWPAGLYHIELIYSNRIEQLRFQFIK